MEIHRTIIGTAAVCKGRTAYCYRNFVVVSAYSFFDVIQYHIYTIQNGTLVRLSHPSLQGTESCFLQQNENGIHKLYWILEGVSSLEAYDVHNNFKKVATREKEGNKFIEWKDYTFDERLRRMELKPIRDDKYEFKWIGEPLFFSPELVVARIGDDMLAVTHIRAGPNFSVVLFKWNEETLSFKKLDVTFRQSNQTVEEEKLVTGIFWVKNRIVIQSQSFQRNTTLKKFSMYLADGTPQGSFTASGTSGTMVWNDQLVVLLRENDQMKLQLLGLNGTVLYERFYSNVLQHCVWRDKLLLFHADSNVSMLQST